MPSLDRVTVPTRFIESWELPPILDRMEIGEAFFIKGITKTHEANRYRQHTTRANRQAQGRATKFKTHIYQGGLFVERWK